MNPQTTNRISLFGWALHAACFGVVLLSIVVFYGTVYRKIHVQKDANRVRSEQLGMLLATSSEIRRKQAPLREELDELRDSIAYKRSRLPEDMKEREFVRQIRETANKVGLQVLDHDIFAIQPGPSVSSVEISFRGNGSFASICNFLNDVHQIARITEISNLELESEINSDGYPFQVTFVLYCGAESNDRKRGKIL
ncbi:MAG: type 4a pilus biogenesis protein PilO [Pirellulales bacterium]|nr:type 4a pilus biogenesis protein PilO [Pirellulales bacterium]